MTLNSEGTLQVGIVLSCSFPELTVT
ncbi:hypothetical protein Nmel_001345 [Mimus melanotis]